MWTRKIMKYKLDNWKIPEYIKDWWYFANWDCLIWMWIEQEKMPETTIIFNNYEEFEIYIIWMIMININWELLTDEIKSNLAKQFYNSYMQ